MNDHQKVKQVVTTLKLNKQVVITTESPSNCRKYLSQLAKKAAKEYITKTVDGGILVIRIK